MIILVLLAVGLVALGSWASFGAALAVLAIGVLVLANSVHRILWTGRSLRSLLEELAMGVDKDREVLDDVDDLPTPHDLPLDSPVRRDLLLRRAAASKQEGMIARSARRDVAIRRRERSSASLGLRRSTRPSASAELRRSGRPSPLLNRASRS